MAKFCGQCGAQLKDDATFCSNCGAQLGGAQQQAFQGGAAVQSNPSENIKNAFNNVKDKLERNPHKKIIVGGVIGVIAAIIVIILGVLIFGGGYKAPLKNYVKVVESGDGKAYKAMTASKKYWEAVEDSKALDKYYDRDVDDYCEKKAEDINNDAEKAMGEGVKLKYTIKDKEKLEKDDLEDFQNYLEKSASSKKIDYEPKVSAGYKLKVSLKAKGDDDSESYTDSLYVYKVDGEWIQGMSPSSASSYSKNGYDFFD